MMQDGWTAWRLRRGDHKGGVRRGSPAADAVITRFVERLAGLARLARLDAGAARHRGGSRGRRSRARHRHRCWRSGTARQGARHVAGIEQLAVERLAGLDPGAARHRAGIEGVAADRATGIGPDAAARNVEGRGTSPALSGSWWSASPSSPGLVPPCRHRRACRPDPGAPRHHAGIKGLPADRGTGILVLPQRHGTALSVSLYHASNIGLPQRYQQFPLRQPATKEPHS